MHSLAETREALGDLPGALKLYEQVLAGRRQVLGDDHPATRSSLNRLAKLRRELSRL